MADTTPTIRCQRCGTQMEMKDPGTTSAPQQYWVCPSCGRHFWSTYPVPAAKDKAAAAQ